MPTLFSRRPAKPKGAKYGAGISNSDLAAFRADSPSDQDARPLPDIPVTAGQGMPLGFDSAINVPSAARIDVSSTAPTDYAKMRSLNAASSGGYSDDAAEFGQRTKSSKASSHRQYLTAPLSSSNPRPSTGSSSNGGAGGSGFRSKRGGSGHPSGAASSYAPSIGGGSTLAPTNGSTPAPEPYPYGYTAAGWDAQLDVPKVTELVKACSEQIRARGLDQPLIFSSMALDLSGHHTTNLIRSYLSSASSLHPSPNPGYGASTATLTPASRGKPMLSPELQQELRFANCHDVAALLKWALARLGSVLAVPVPLSEHPNRRGEVREETIFVQQRGFLELDHYLGWREEERRREYPTNAFASYLDNLHDPAAAKLLDELFALLSSTTSYSLKNGMTPSKLARIFGAILFGLPEDETFERTYDAYTRASNATEHLFLAYIRNSASHEQLPTRLKEHVAGYPAMLPTDTSLPAKHVRGVPLTQVERQVRLYSTDLVQTACEVDVAGQSQEWRACCSQSEDHGKDPQLSDRLRKLLNARNIGKQGRGAASSSGRHSSSGGASGMSPRGGSEADNAMYASLAAKDWGDFMSSGFAAPDESKLAFDLKESERKNLGRKRETVQWNDFTSMGFDAEESGLDSVLDFDDALKAEVGRLPEERAEILNKLRDRTKKLPSFPYDTTPRVISSPTTADDVHGQWTHHPISRVDEVFAEVWADYLIGNGWSNRDELTHRNANWVMVQYKSRPGPSTLGTLGHTGSASSRAAVSVAVPKRNEFGETIQPDDRTDAAWFVIQEIVPSQYRAELDAAGRLKGRSLPSLRKLKIFKRKKDKSSSHEDTWNASHDPNDVFRPGTGGWTKQIKLDSTLNLGRDSQEGERAASTPGWRSPDLNGDSDRNAGGGSSGSRLLNNLRSRTIKRNKRQDDSGDVGPPALPPKSPKHLQAGGRDSSFGSSDFDTRSLHEDDMDDDDGEVAVPRRKRGLLSRMGHERRESKDDAWLDVMIRANGFRMAGQDVEMKPRTGPRVQEAAPAPEPAAVDDDEAKDGLPYLAPTPKANGASESSAMFAGPAPTGLAPSAPAPVDIVAPAAAPAAIPTPYEPVKIMSSSPPRLASERQQASTASPSRSGDETPVRRGGGGGSPAARTVPLAPIQTPVRTTSKEDVPSALSEKRGIAIERLKPTISPSSPAVPVNLKSPNAASGPQPIVAPPPGTHTLRSTEAERLEKERARQARIDAAKERARELRAGLQHVDFRKASPASDGAASSPLTSPTAPRIDPFAKGTTAGRVASIAGKFGGPAKGGVPLTPQATGGSIGSLPRSPAKATAGASEPPSSPPATSDKPASLSVIAGAAPASAGRPDSWLEDPDVPPSPRPRNSQDGAMVPGSSDVDSIYPDDAASNFSRDTHSTDDGPDFGGSPAMRPAAAAAAIAKAAALSLPPPAAPTSENGFAADADRAEEEDAATDMPIPFRVPYQPGMPLDNVAEESESMLSGSNNI